MHPNTDFYLEGQEVTCLTPSTFRGKDVCVALDEVQLTAVFSSCKKIAMKSCVERRGSTEEQVLFPRKLFQRVNLNMKTEDGE